VGEPDSGWSLGDVGELYQSNQEQRVEKIPEYFGSIKEFIGYQFQLRGYDGYQAQKIAWCESRHYPTAQNPHSSAKGLFQIIDLTWTDFGCLGDPLNPTDNVLCALKIYRDGTQHWKQSSICWNSNYD